MKKLLFLITPLLIFTLLFSACSPTEKDNFENTLAYFQIDFIKSDFEMTESTSDKADYVRAYKVSVTEKERKKLIEHFKSFENGEFVKIPNAQNNFDILCDTLIEDFGSYKAVKSLIWLSLIAQVSHWLRVQIICLTLILVELLISQLAQV